MRKLMTVAAMAALVAAVAGCATEPPIGSRGDEVRPAGGSLASVWTNRGPSVPSATNSPAARRRAAMAFDPTRGVAVLHGGQEAVANDTWEWTSATRTWAKMNIALANDGPLVRDHNMAYFDGKIVLFGGRESGGSTEFNDTWVYAVGDGATRTWTKLKVTGPPVRYGAAMAVYPGVGLVVTGGRRDSDGGATYDDTWLLDMANDSGTWTVVTDGGHKPTPRYLHGMDFTGGDQLLLFGGVNGTTPRADTTWSGTFDAGMKKLSWTKLDASRGDASARAGIALVYDGNRDRAIVFGGDTGTYDDHTFVFAPPTGPWVDNPVSSASSPGARALYAATFDTSRNVMLLFGGEPGPLGDTWEHSFSRQPTINAPDASGREKLPVTVMVTASDTDNGGKTLKVELTSVDPVPPSNPDLKIIFPDATTTGNGPLMPQLAWIPGCKDHNNAAGYTFTFKVTDGDGNTATDTSNVKIDDFDCLPVFDEPTIPPFQEGRLDSFTISAHDDDGDAVMLTMDTPISPNPAVDPTFLAPAATTPITGTFTWDKPGPSDGGTYMVTFHAKDAGHAAVNKTVQVVVGSVNSQPKLVLPAPQTMTEGSLGMFSVSATDDDGDPVTITLTSLLPPPVVAPMFNGSTFTWTPGFLDDGVYTATFSATDNHGPAATGTVMITVLNSNRNPVLVVAPPGNEKSVSETHPITFSVSVSDPDTDDATSVTAGALPEGASFENGTFSWTPNNSQGSIAGTPYDVTFTGGDGHVTVMTTVRITVADVNQPPVVTPIPPKTVAEGGVLTFQILATDPDGTPLTYTARSLPPGASFNATNGTFIWSPDCTAADATNGATEARFGVSDGVDTVDVVVPITVTGTIVSVSPRSLIFPTTRVGSSATPLTVTISNGRPQPVTLVNATTSNAVYPVSAGSLTRPIPGNGSTTVQVGFTPSSSMTVVSALTITIADAACSTLSVPLTGAGQTAGVQVSRSGADFGVLRVGSVSDPTSFTVTNVGDANFVVSAVSLSNLADFTLELQSPSTYPVTLKPGETVTFAVRAVPSMVGLRSGTVNVVTDIPGAGPTQLALLVEGVAPVLEVSDVKLDFGAVDVQGAGAMKTLKLTNGGGTTLTVGSPSLSGPGASAYKVTGGGSGAILVSPGASTSFVVTYKPISESANEQSAAVNITSDAPDTSSIVVSLAGHGIDRHATAAPASVGFGSIAPKATKMDKVTLTNMGQAPLKLGTPALAIEGSGAAAFALPAQAPASVAPMGSLEVAVVFQPPAAGSYAADLVIRSDDSDAPVLRVALTGTATGVVVAEGVDLHGGGLLGCQVGAGGGGGGGAGAVWLALAGVALLLLRRRALALLLLVAGTADADPATAFDLGVFRPQLMPGSALVTVERPSVLPAGDLGASLTLDYGLHPLFAMKTSTGDEEAAVSGRAAMTLAAAYGVADRLELVAAMPFLVQSGSSQMTGVVAASGFALGDLEAGGRAVIVPARLAASVTVTLPTGDDSQYAGAAGAGAHLCMVGGVDAAGFHLAANAGVRFRLTEARLGEIKQGHELTYGAGGSHDLGGWGEALLELYGAVGLADVKKASPLELLAALRAWPAANVAVTGGAGAGIIDGIGAADARFFVTVAYAPRDRRPPHVRQAEAEKALAEMSPPERPEPPPVPDSDGDGIVDPADRCPTEREDKDGWEDADGCPDPDNDLDGIPDGEDACATEAEVINGIKDDDGCPDKGDPAVLLSKDRIELLAAVAFDGVALRPASRLVLGQVQATLRAHPEIKHLTIAVHVRRRGADDQRVSEKRADAIRRFLTDKGIDGARLNAVGYGSSRPLGRETVDRVELLIGP